MVNWKGIVKVAVVTHIGLALYALGYNAVGASLGGFLEPLSWPVFSVGALVGAAVIGTVVTMAEKYVKL